MKKKLSHRLASLFRSLSFAPRPHTAAVILAGGSGTRMGEGEVAKQWMTLGGCTLLQHAVAAFEACPHIDEIVVVVRRGEGEKAAGILRAMGTKKVRAVVAGGKSRQQSAYHGARRVSKETRYIAIHDAARPLVLPADISAAVLAAYADKAASLGVPVVDTVKRVNARHYVVETKDRDELWLAATPQVFSYPLYMGAAVGALKAGAEVTDDNMLMERIGQRVRMVPATGPVLKVTTPKDLAYAEAILRLREREDRDED
ncbi:MAG: 2-C-methyl-D-erythritol 4-phosphate cytidylyltransferase [Clostridia bacterium]|nr:2-C-methyl-D-erythritol 4-phosphate cytidylyltransferase [Clostridia bacterium]